MGVEALQPRVGWEQRAAGWDCRAGAADPAQELLEMFSAAVDVVLSAACSQPAVLLFGFGFWSVQIGFWSSASIL